MEDANHSNVAALITYIDKKKTSGLRASSLLEFPCPPIHTGWLVLHKFHSMSPQKLVFLEINVLTQYGSHMEFVIIL